MTLTTIRNATSACIGPLGQVEWACDTSWRFPPVIKSELFGYQLHPIDLAINKVLALDGADAFVRRRPPEEAGCLYYAIEQQRFVDPDEAGAGQVVPHFGAPGGVLPRILEDAGETQ